MRPVSTTSLSSFMRHGRGYWNAYLPGLPDANGPRTVSTSLATSPRSEVYDPAPSAEPAGASAGTASLTVDGGVVSGAAVIEVTALAPVR